MVDTTQLDRGYWRWQPLQQKERSRLVVVAAADAEQVVA